MKDGKPVEKTIYRGLILSVVGLSITIGLLFLISVFYARANWGIPQQIFQAIRIVIILLVIVFALQVGVLIYKVQSKEKICPKCQNPLPQWRIPRNGYEVFVGGWTCPSCGAKLTWRLRERK